MLFKWQFALIAAFIAHRSSNINVPLSVVFMVALQAWLARLAWLWKSRFHFHGGLLLQDSHANAHALLSELALNTSAVFIM
jgi:hypothetical protein